MARTAGSNGAKTLEAIREAGADLIYRHGYEAMSLRALAAAVGVQVGSLYNHIKTKQDLLFFLMRSHMEQLLAERDACEGVFPPAPPPARLRAFVEFHLGFHLTRKRDISLANFELRSLEPDNYAVVVAMRADYERTLTDILTAGRESGAFAVPEPRLAAFGILSMLTGACMWYRPEGRLSKADIIAAYTDMATKSVAV
ncbi:MAG TPA: TetR/AcrR family transcriptional regulator [Azospirillaceae bacterium]|nr:TetR/AcrR family transcriptional regulator [Azospirillaceae bacterium]HRQ79790.1 TetR/AcrR family transcriptional regulator [Azospirillaceae bacterium]